MLRCKLRGKREGRIHSTSLPPPHTPRHRRCAHVTTTIRPTLPSSHSTTPACHAHAYHRTINVTKHSEGVQGKASSSGVMSANDDGEGGKG
jgi:hypothetical protein